MATGTGSKRSRKSGMPPGALIHIGEPKSAKARATLVRYDADDVSQETLHDPAQCLPPAEGGGVTWIDLDGIHEIGLTERIGDCYGLHPLVLEDILNTEQRPKVEAYEGYLYIVLKMLSYDHARNEILFEQISLVLGPNFVLSFQERPGNVFDSVRERLRANRGRIRKRGADYLAYALLDAVIDSYFAILETSGEQIEALEERLVTSPEPDALPLLHKLKREMIFLRKAVWPLREVVSALLRRDSPLIGAETVVFLRDVYDHTIQVIESVETFRDMLAGMLDIYLSSVSNRLNGVMKVLTVITTVFMPLTLISGIYGMNFRHMPELDWRWGYPAVLLAMLAIGGAMLAVFKRKGWL